MVKLYQILKELEKVATLTTFVTYYKKTIFFLAAFLIIAVALIAFSNLLGKIIDSLTGANKIPPIVAFGKLPILDLSGGVKPTGDTIYEIETITGDLPNLNTSAKVFAIKKQVATFSDLEDSKKKAKALKFLDTPVENIGGNVTFQDSKDESRKLTVQIVSQSFKLDSNYLSDFGIISGHIRSEDAARSSAIDFLRSTQIPINQFPPENIIIENYKIEQGKLAKSSSLAGTNLTRVIFNRPDIEGLPIFDINRESPSVWALTTGDKIVAAQYNSFEVSKHKFSTYPLKGVKKAFEELKNGNGTLNKNLESNVFEIRKVKLGYLQTRTFQDFLEPVYVFESDNNLAAFVNAVENQWIELD